MAAAANPDDRKPIPSQHGPILARLTDGSRLTFYGDAATALPDAEWFEVACADGKIVLSPIPDPKEARRQHIAELGLLDEQAAPPSTEWELTSPAERAKSPYAHLTLDQLRTLEHLTAEQWFDELRARGHLLPAYDGPRPQQQFKPIYPPVPPGGLERFLKERAEQD